MKLLGSPTSPFVRKVNVMLIETGLDAEVETVQLSTTPFATSADVSAANPLGKIPALIRGDGPAIYDSRVITRYLDAYKSTGLYPESRLWETLTLEATADGIMDAAVAMVYEHRMRPEEKTWDGWADAQWEKIARAVQTINDRWMSHLSGPLDMSHIAVGCALSYLDFRHDVRGWRKGPEALAKWHQGFDQRDSMQATVPVG